MKVCVVTLIDYTNYGNRLQNYAMNEILRDNGVEVVNGLEYVIKAEWVQNSHGLTKAVVKYAPWSVISFIHKMRHQNPPKKFQGRFSNFKKFTSSYMNTFPTVYARNYAEFAKKIDEKNIDYFIVGSDQIWNPQYRGRRIDYLNFTSDDKKLSFAASMGVDLFPTSKNAYIKEMLSSFKYVSVRETNAQKYLQSIGIDADVSPDPTLLLELSRWNSLLEGVTYKTEQNYICTYFLGDVPSCVEEYARKHNMKIHALNDSSNELFDLDPVGFLYYIKNSSMVITDSFHAAVFSIIFNKDFYVVPRQQKNVNGMFSRIENLLSEYGLEDRIQSRDAIVDRPAVNSWDAVNSKLEETRKISLNKLNEFIK